MKAGSGIASWVGVGVSAACVVHCWATPLVASLIPVLGLSAHSEWLEWVFWLLAVGALILHLREERWGWLSAGLALALTVGGVGLVIEQHELLHFGFYGFGAGMTLVLIRRWRGRRACSHSH